MSNPAPYRFPGIADFVPRAGVKPTFVAKIPSIYMVGRVADALSQIPTTDPRHRASMFEVAREGIDALKAALATVEAAYADVEKHCPIPDDPAKPKPHPEAQAVANDKAKSGHPLQPDPNPDTDPNAVTDARFDADKRDNAKDKQPSDDKVDGTPARARLGDNQPAEQHAPQPKPKNRP